MLSTKPGDTVTFHRSQSITLAEDAEITDLPAKVLAVTHVIDRDTPILVLEINLADGPEILRSVSNVREHPALRDLEARAIAVHQARGGHWS